MSGLLGTDECEFRGYVVCGYAMCVDMRWVWVRDLYSSFYQPVVRISCETFLRVSVRFAVKSWVTEAKSVAAYMLDFCENCLQDLCSCGTLAVMFCQTLVKAPENQISCLGDSKVTVF